MVNGKIHHQVEKKTAASNNSVLSRHEKDNTPMTETSQVDLLIIGNSNVSRIQAGKLYANKVCRVIKLDPLHKHIDGAIAYTKQCQITVRAKKILPSSGRVRQTAQSR